MDYLRSVATIHEVWYAKTESRLEHHWAKAASMMPQAKIPVKGFGSSDCRCISHLFYVPQMPNIRFFRNNIGKSTKNAKSYRIYSFSGHLSVL
jgi:Uri superfamily endonuclease